MFLTNIIHRKLLFLLRPWLRDEPELELELGLINSIAILKNISFSDLALSKIVDEESSNVYVKEVNVEHLCLRFSSWSSTAFSFEVRGIHVMLSARKKKEGGSKKLSNSASEDLKKSLYAIDPEGCALHAVLERVFQITQSRSRIKTSILNLILNHCHLKALGVKLQLQFPISSDSFAYISELNELNAESQYFQQGCLFRGLVFSLIRPLKGSSFVISGSGFEIGYKSNDHINHVCCSNEIFASCKLDELQLVHSDLHFQELSFSLSPVDLAVFTFLGELSSKDLNHVRNGRLLWKLASTRIGSVISAPSLLLQNFAAHVSLWLRYVNAYEYILFKLGYSVDHLLKRSLVKIFQDKAFLASVKNNWEVVTDIEKELPPEAIAQARRIARYRAALNVQQDEDRKKEFFARSQLKVFCKILSLLACIWNVTYKIFHLIVHHLFLSKLSTEEPKSNVCLEIVSEYSYPNYCFSLYLEKLLVIFYPEYLSEPATQRLESETGIAYSDFLSFYLSVDLLVLTYTEEISEKSMFISCGQPRVTSSTFIKARKSSSKDFIASVKGHRKGRVTGVKNVLWGEPAKNPPSLAENAFDPMLETFLRETWISWDKLCLKLDESGVEYFENPWLLCEIKSFLTYPDIRNPDSGLWRCNLTVGKLNLALGYSSMLSIALLLKQIKLSVCWTEGNRTSSLLSRFPETIAHQPEIKSDDKYENFVNRIKMFLCRMLPEKYIQIGVLIVGPHIQFSSRMIGFQNGLEDMNHLVGQDDFYHEFDVHNIEFVACPLSESESTSITRISGSEDAKLDCLRLQEPQIISKSDNEKYESRGWISLSAYLRINGLNAYLLNPVENQQNQVFVLKPISFHLSSLREYNHSLTTTAIAFSATVCGTASGFTILSFMEEFYALFQVFAGSFSAVSYAINSSKHLICVPFKEYIWQDAVSSEHEDEETTVKGASLMCTSTLFSLNGTFKLELMDIFCYNSRIKDKVDYMKNIDALSGKKLADDLLDYGVWISVHQTCVDLSCEVEKMEVLLDVSGIKSQLVRYEDHRGKSFDHLVLSSLLLESHNCLHEFSLSNCIFTLWLGRPHAALSSCTASDTHSGSSSGGNISCSVEDSHLTGKSEESKGWSFRFVQKLGFAPNIFTPAPSHWILLNISFGEILISRCSVKNALVGSHQVNKLLSSLSVGGEFQTISWSIQGGLCFLEITTFLKFVRCFSLYCDYVANLLSILQSSAEDKGNVEDNLDTARPNGDYIEESVQGTILKTSKAKRGLPEVFIVDVSQVSLILVFEDESGIVRELVLELDAQMNIGITNLEKKFMIDISRLSIVSQYLQDSMENENLIPHFSSVSAIESSSGSVAGEGPVTVQFNDQNGSFDGASCSKTPLSRNEFAMNNNVSKVFHLSHQKYILEHFGAFVSAKKLENNWAGHGSISGFDMTISLSELQMILSTISSSSGIPSKELASKRTQRHQSINQETSNSLNTMVPNGTIVAIQDVHQHMYFTVEGGDKYTLAGAIHYSLVGERALFRVEYHNQRRWKSSVLWFSLISLYAKNDSGKPLRLNYHSGSSFVDISSTDDNSWALWRILPCESETYKGDVDRDPQNQLVKDNFYLVNKKNDCAVAFIDGLPEFVKKPGNPFKFKVFNNLSLSCDLVASDGYSQNSSGTNVCCIKRDDEGKTSRKSGSLPCINIKIDKVALTIVHELLDTMDRFPLIRGCVSNTQLVVQSLSTKARVISTSMASLSYFDAQNNLWSELVHPVEICIYCRSSFQVQGSETSLQGVPLHIYCRIKEFQIFLTELSLDILLLVIGKLNLAGPYSIRSSQILANCCKIENQSGLNLLCCFYNEQSMTVGRKQSAYVFLRHSTLANQPPDSSSVVSIQLSFPGSFMTSPIYLSLLEARSLAWRTRILSAQESRTYPGPFIVVDISRTSEDGLSIMVSPLIRIHNETEFSMELRFRRVQEKEDEFASILLKPGDTIDDSMAMFDAINFSGGLKRALVSLSVGNFLFSFRPGSLDGLKNSRSSLSAEWSEELEGGKAVQLTGIFDKLSYEVRRVLSVGSEKCSFSTAHCALKSDDMHQASMHFLIQSIGRDVPIIEPDKDNDGFNTRSLPVALQQQKEIFLLPTVRVSNLLRLEIHVLLTEADLFTTTGVENIGKQATITCGSTADFYANPGIMYFSVTLVTFKSTCKWVNSSDWVKKLLKNKNDIRYLDIDLDFGAGKYFASLRLLRGQRGILEAAIFTPYTLRNETDSSLLFYAPNQKPLSRDEVGKVGSGIPPELGLFLPPKSTGSWFPKSHKIRLRLLEDHSSEALLDLDALSGLTELKLETKDGSGAKYISKFGVSMGPPSSKVAIPSQMITIVPRHVIVNESEERIIVRQCYLEDDMAGMIYINSKQRAALRLRDAINRKREFSSFENFIRKHRNDNDKLLVFIQFLVDGSELDWSGPLCISSLGRFFLKFRKQSNQMTKPDKSATEFAAVYVAEEGSTLVVQFHKPPNVNLPYRIENHLRDASVTYYQKDSSQPEVLGPGRSVDYAWDDLTLPHKLVVVINDMHQLREINLDKVRPWKPFFKLKQHRGLASHVIFDRKLGDRRTVFGEFNGVDMVKVGYEVSADGTTRVLRICKSSDSRKGDAVFQFCAKIQLRISHLALHLLEKQKQDLGESDASLYTPVVVARLGDINLDCIFTDQQKFNQICTQSLNVEYKWAGAPFAAMLRRHQLGDTYSNDCVLKIICILLSTSSNVKQVKHSSIVLQPVDLNLDEETLMRIVSFWRTSLSDSNTQSQQFYFDHFEVHPIKIIASFLPGESYLRYNSAQETLRSLLHSVVKVPPIKNMVVELNGVLVTHALITTRELLNRCAQHYLWYAMRSIYIAKGSPLLPPAFNSIFDDLASSSLDVFFDPSHALTNLPGLTLGTFKFISKCIDGKGFSGTKRYFGDLGKTLKTAGSNVIFAAVTEISDSVLKGAETSGFDGLVSGFHQGILKLAMEPSLLGSALIGGGADRRIKLDRSAGVDELYIEGYLQAMLDTMYRQEYLRVRVIENQVFLKNLPPSNTLINEIMDRVKGFLESEGLLKGDPSTTSRPTRHLRGESEWKIGPTVMTLCEHLFVSFAIRMLRRRADKLIARIKWKEKSEADDKAVVPAQSVEGQKNVSIWKWGIGKFVLSGIIAYIDGRLCRGIPNPIARRIVGGFLLSFLDKSDK